MRRHSKLDFFKLCQKSGTFILIPRDSTNRNIMFKTLSFISQGSSALNLTLDLETYSNILLQLLTNFNCSGVLGFVQGPKPEYTFG